MLKEKIRCVYMGKKTEKRKAKKKEKKKAMIADRNKTRKSK